MSIPFFFRPVRHDVPAATFDGVDFPAGTVTWVDGGLLSNFPVEVFDRSDGSPARWPTLGIKLSAREVVLAPPREHHGPLAEGLACVRVAVDNADRYYLTPDAVARTIFIDTDHISSTDFHLTAEQRQTLYANGRKPPETGWPRSRRSPHLIDATAEDDVMVVSEEVGDALREARPVLAMESTIFTHGKQRRQPVEQVIRSGHDLELVTRVPARRPRRRRVSSRRSPSRARRVSPSGGIVSRAGHRARGSTA